MIRKKLVGACVAFALVCGTAMAEPYQLNNGGVINHPYPMQPSNVAQCASGFTAIPATIDPKNPYNQSYTCTASAIVCSPGFKPVAIYLPSQGQGQLFGPLSPSSPLTMKNGRVMYTCQEPPLIQ
jgi:hypothetical protein